jgi:flagellar basal-body rod modification protein FlgD
MTTPVSNSSVFQQLGLGQQSDPSKATSGNQLDMNAFLTLMTEQMKDQDPTKPMDSSQYLGQLAQFANLQGVQQLNTGIAGIQSLMGQQESLQVADLVGHDAYIKTDSAQLEAGGNVDGAVTMTGPGDVNFTVKDAKGNVVRTFTKTADGAGDMDFSWDGTTDAGAVAPAGNYTISATTGSTKLDTQIAAKIESVSFTSQGIVLNLEGHDAVTFDQILSIS